MYLFAIVVVIVVMIALLKINNSPDGQTDKFTGAAFKPEYEARSNDGWFNYSGNIGESSDPGGFDGGGDFDGSSSDGGGNSSSGFQAISSTAHISSKISSNAFPVPAP